MFIPTSSVGLGRIAGVHSTVWIFTITASYGTPQIAALFDRAADGHESSARTHERQANFASTEAGYARRRQEWNFQAQQAEAEIARVDGDIVAAKLRLAIAHKEQGVHERQIEHDDQRREFHLGKFTGEQLYDWLLPKIPEPMSSTHELERWYRGLDGERRRSLEWTLAEVLVGDASRDAEFPRFLRVGTLDAPERCPPDIHIYTSTKLPWVVLPEGAKAVPEFYEVAEIWPAESRERVRAMRRRLKEQAAVPDTADPGS